MLILLIKLQNLLKIRFFLHEYALNVFMDINGALINNNAFKIFNVLMLIVFIVKVQVV